MTYEVHVLWQVQVSATFMWSNMCPFHVWMRIKLQDKKKLVNFGKFARPSPAVQPLVTTTEVTTQVVTSFNYI